MALWPVLIIASWLQGACTGDQHRLVADQDTEVSISGTELAYRGDITHEANRRLLGLAASSAERAAKLVITSPGGDVEAGIELGTWIFESGLDVHVPEYCMSSCANYAFVAGRTKILSPAALLVWHGGATQYFDVSCKDVTENDAGIECDEAELQRAFKDQLDRLRDLESVFFKKIGVDQRITVLGQDTEYDCREGDGYIGWYYAIEDLEALGVDRVIVLGDVWQPVVSASDARVCQVKLLPPLTSTGSGEP